MIQSSESCYEKAILFLPIRKKTVFSLSGKRIHHDVPSEQKRATYNSVMYRLLNFPLNEARYNDELSYIKYVAVLTDLIYH